MKYMSSMLVVKDMARSKAFYKTVLGLSVTADLGANVILEGALALQTAESWQMFTGCRTEPARRNETELDFEEENYDDFLARLNQADLVYLHENREMPWGQRCVRFYDPDGHLIEVSEPIDKVCIRLAKQGLSLEEISQKTLIPPEVLRQNWKED